MCVCGDRTHVELRLLTDRFRPLDIRLLLHPPYGAFFLLCVCACENFLLCKSVCVP